MDTIGRKTKQRNGNWSETLRRPTKAEVSGMPFKSKKQMRYLFKFHPKIAKKWAKKYGTKVRKSGKRKK